MITKEFKFFNELGLNPENVRPDEFACLCPFHKESKPSFHLNTSKEKFYCFGCETRGNFITLIQRILEVDILHACSIHFRYFGKNRSNSAHSLYNSNGNMEGMEGRKPPSQKILATLQPAYGHSYLKERGISYRTAKEYDIRWNPEFGAIAIPAYNEKDEFVGLINRRIESHKDRYRYSPHFPKKSILFNLNNVLRGVYQGITTSPKSNSGLPDASAGPSIIVTEGSLDVLRLHSCGITNAVATLGNSLSDYQTQLVKLYFNKAILAFDNDQSGKFYEAVSEKKLRAVCHPNFVIQKISFPVGIKDFGEATKKIIYGLIDENS